MSFIAIRNWSEHQHYKDRTAPWIKLYRDMLDSEMWVMSSDASKLLAICLMMLALRNDNKIPADPEYIKRFGHLEFLPDFTELIKHKFIDFIDENGECLQFASAMLATCPTEKRRTEGEENKTEGEGEKILVAEKSELPTIPNSGNSKKQNAASVLAALGVSDEVAADWIQLRKTKRASITKTALNGMQRESTKAGISLEDAMRICCEKGWAAFDSSWDWKSRSGGQSGNTKADQIAKHNEQVAAEFLGSGEKTIEAEVVNA